LIQVKLKHEEGLRFLYSVLLRRRTISSFAASVISSVIALAKPENRSERTKADERIGKH